MRFGILGRLEVSEDGEARQIGGPKQRSLLAALLVQANQAVSAEHLASVLWIDPTALRPDNALHTQISRLRSRLNGASSGLDGRLIRQGPGYLLRVGDDELDAFEAAAASRASLDALAAGDWHRAIAEADRALACWRGPALEEFAHEPFAQARAARLDEQRLLTAECRIDAGLALGRHRELVSDLQDLVNQNPLREELWCQLILTLYRSGRQGDALRAYERVRHQLADELGITPCADLVRLERAVLDQDGSLDWRPLAQHPTRRDRPGASGQVVAHNLPHQDTSFIGRDAERAMVAAALHDARLVTVSGSGGCGKTRLALAVADEVRDRFPDGVWFVDLVAVSDPALVARAMATPLGVETNVSSQLDYLCERIGDAEMLFVLDGCEHLVRPVADTVAQLLERCRSTRFLATSREELFIPAERACRIPALSLPVADSDDQEPFLNSEAVQLFVERGCAVLADFSPTDDALDEVALACQMLDGIPLAIEVASSWVDHLAPVDITERLADRLRLLAQGRRQALPRHRTLSATLAWSFDVLTEDARRLFPRLAVFVGDFTLGAVEGIAGDMGGTETIRDALDFLVTRSLVRRTPGRGGGDRYRLLDTVRQHAQERLVEYGHPDEVARGHARFYAAFAADAKHKCHSHAAADWLALVASELPNLRSAVSWALTHEELEIAAVLAGSLRWYYGRLGLLDEAIAWLAPVLDPKVGLPQRVRLEALITAATVARMVGDFGWLRQVATEAVALARRGGDDHELAIALNLQGAACINDFEMGRAVACFEEAHRSLGQDGCRWCAGWILSGWGVASAGVGRPDLAGKQFAECLTIFRALGDLHGQVLPLVSMAFGTSLMGQLELSLRLAREAEGLARQARDPQLEQLSITVVGRIELAMGRNESARERLVRSSHTFPGASNQAVVALALEGLSLLAHYGGAHTAAARLVGFTAELRRRWNTLMTTPWEAEREKWLDRAREILGPERVELELERGAGLSLDAAIALAAAATEPTEAAVGPADADVSGL